MNNNTQYKDSALGKIPRDWSKSELGKLLETLPAPYKLRTSEYLIKGKYPIVDQGKKQIVAYTNNDEVIINNLPFLLSDTVGFIRKLPHHLVQSFKSTLDEVREADLLLHVVDVSHSNFEEQLEVVNQTLQEIDPQQKPMILIFNKIDAFGYTPKEEDDLAPIKRENISLEELKKTWMAKMHDNCIFISAKEKLNIDSLKELLYEKIKTIHIERYPYNDFLFQNYTDIETEPEELTQR